MQNTEITRFFNYIERTSRPDVWDKRKRLARPLIEAKYSSINLLVRSVDGNTRDAAWISQAFKDREIVRSREGKLQLTDEAAMRADEAQLEEVYRCISELTNLDGELGDAIFKAVQRAQALIEAERIARGEEP